VGAHVLIADDDPAVLAALVLVSRAAGHRTSQASSGAQAVRAARAERPDVCLLDLRLPECDGLAVLHDLLALEGAPSVVVMTGATDVLGAVRALDEGACDLLEKPVRREALESVLARVLSTRSALRERDLLRACVARLRSGPIVGRSPAIRRLQQQIERVASTPRTTVLVLGEVGTGKELVARAIHERSARSHAPFLAACCAARPAALLDAELFGCEPGERKGTSGAREGLIAAAEGGSLFLDEVSALAQSLQAKLVRALQERVVRRAGGSSDRTTDVRVIASTSRDLESEVDAGRFREDLYYRLNVMSVRVPPLRERAEDVSELAQHFLARFAAELGRTLTGFDGAAIERLRAQAWPGNVRELANTIERAALLAKGERVEVEDLGLSDGGRAPPSTLAPALPAARVHAPDVLPLGDRSLRAVEEALIRRVLQENAGNRKRSAEILGINRTTLYHKLKSFRIDA